MSARKKCRPRHNWRTPKAGDTALVCVECGRAIDYYHEMNPNIAASILGGIERNTGPEQYESFRNAFISAQNKERERHPNATQDCERCRAKYHSKAVPPRDPRLAISNYLNPPTTGFRKRPSINPPRAVNKEVEG